MLEHSLTSFNLTRPEKIRWIFPTQGDVLEHLKSKSLVAFLRTVDQDLTANDITYVFKDITEQEYQEWLPFYAQKMSEQQHQILAKSETYQQKRAEGKQLQGLFFYQHGQLVGSGIIIRIGTQEAHLAYKASDRLELSNKPNSSLGSVIDYFFLVEMKKEGVNLITGGRSRNQFGVSTTIGYLDFKLRFGFTPVIEPSQPQLDTAELNEHGFCLFFAGQPAGTTKLFLLRPSTPLPQDRQLNDLSRLFPITTLTTDHI